MELCNKCNYLYTIRKANKKKKDINSIKELLLLVNNLSNYNINISKNNIIKNKSFKKLSKKVQDHILSYINKNNNISIEFFCSNCNNTKLMTKSTKIHEINKNKLQNKILEDHIINLHLNNPILPRTKLYVCRNKKCTTHKNPKLKKVIFFKDNNNLRYICSVCKSYWLT